VTGRSEPGGLGRVEVNRVGAVEAVTVLEAAADSPQGVSSAERSIDWFWVRVSLSRVARSSRARLLKLST